MAIGFTEQNWRAIADSYRLFKPSIATIARRTVKLADDGWDLSSASYVLDVGCGPGIMMEVLIEDHASKLAENTKLHATDSSSAMVDQMTQLRDSKIKEGLGVWSRLETSSLDVHELQGIPDDSVSHVTAGLVLFAVKDPRKALTEIRRVLTKENNGGVLALSSWQRSDWMDLMLLLRKIRPEHAESMPPWPVSWRTAKGVEQELEATGYRNVQASSSEVEVLFDDHDQVVNVCLNLVRVMGTAAEGLTAEELEKLRKLMMEDLTRLHPAAPLRLKGTVITAFGRK